MCGGRNGGSSYVNEYMCVYLYLHVWNILVPSFILYFF